VANFDQSAIASDIPRSRKQWLARGLSNAVIKTLGLNRPGFWRTEFLQILQPTVTIETAYGPLLCRCNHGRLLWRAQTFHTEEPETVQWLDSLTPDDTLWDIGANVGLYSLYAAKFRGCHVLAVEPESQNYALLVDNIALNGVGKLCLPACMGITRQFGLQKLDVLYLTKGAAYNSCAPFSNGQTGSGKGTIQQLLFGVSLDDLVLKYGLPAPTHLKVDVDGLEPEIIDGAQSVLSGDRLSSILIEINRSSERDLAIPSNLKKHGFELVSERSNWESRSNRAREQECPTTNLIFVRKK
jgi:FkbM family methyltransferase